MPKSKESDQLNEQPQNLQPRPQIQPEEQQEEPTRLRCPIQSCREIHEKRGRWLVTRTIDGRDVQYCRRCGHPYMPESANEWETVIGDMKF